MNEMKMFVQGDRQKIKKLLSFFKFHAKEYKKGFFVSGFIIQKVEKNQNLFILEGWVEENIIEIQNKSYLVDDEIKQSLELNNQGKKAPINLSSLKEHLDIEKIEFIEKVYPEDGVFLKTRYKV